MNLDATNSSTPAYNRWITDAAVKIELDAQYRAMREQAGVLARPQRTRIDVAGAEAAEYLQGQLTNDVEALEPGQGCYAALLDRKGHLQSDLRALRLDQQALLLDAEAAPGEALLKHLSMYKIGRDVEVVDRSADAAMVSVLGPRSQQLTGAESLTGEHDHLEVELGGVTARAVATEHGVDLLVDGSAAPSVVEALLGAGAEAVSEEAAEILRVESGRPRFGLEMGPEAMPAEAGIVERAVNFKKGCYIGQEPVARLHYRGRPNRVLRGLRLSSAAERGVALRLGEKEVGRLGTTGVSPALGPIGLAIVRREAEPGATLELDDGVTAEVVELPFPI
ncbi:MAG: folate-binding protein [Actinomycetota bacterium]|nr:folate-binding protein [Actinomycetota bacterium]